nr:pentapeptide repeat-containing protein [Ferrimicrobium sp.]
MFCEAAGELWENRRDHGSPCQQLPKSRLRRHTAQGEDFRRANLKRGDLRRADLRDADYRRANLRYSDLRGADLAGADLAGADLTGADLTGADLRGALVDESTILPVGYAIENGHVVRV